MRHNKSGRKLGRKTASRKALMLNLASALITHKRIKTTDAKGKPNNQMTILLNHLASTNFKPLRLKIHAPSNK